MSYFYFDPSRESDPYALLDGEAFYVEAGEWGYDQTGERCEEPEEPGMGWEPCEAGWYYWACFPGCLPDGDPIGPFGSEAAAIAEAQDDYAEGMA